jgi:outer membrane protein OmpA-like peptidoglycan-associated protein
MRHIMTLAPLLVVAMAACATKKFVQTRVSEVGEKADAIGRSIEQTQERTRQNETRITQVDSRAQTAATTAQQANSAAGAAQNTANAAGAAAKAADAKLDAVDRASRRLVLQLVLTENEGGFKFDGSDLPDAAQLQIDQIVSQLKQDAKNVYIEIEGHTDNVGPAEYNERLGLERAEAVQRYLYEKYQVPLHRMSVISYGMSRPEADNKTKEGRALNRRVVIRVLG